MRGTALVVLLCLFAAVTAHVLAEQAHARDAAVDEMCDPCEVSGNCAAADGFAPPPEASDSPTAGENACPVATLVPDAVVASSTVTP